MGQIHIALTYFWKKYLFPTIWLYRLQILKNSAAGPLLS